MRPCRYWHRRTIDATPDRTASSAQGEGNLSRDGVRGQRQQNDNDLDRENDEGTVTELLPSSGLATSSDEYYPTVAINALMR
eukprot:1194128-Prorocentrum_minimum.AAC.1